MWTLTKTFEFDAAHRALPHHGGKCSGLHGHTWKVDLRVRGSRLDVDGSSSNMVVDFHDLSRVIKEVSEKYLDHKFLNESLGEESPTSEFLARWLFTQFKTAFPNIHSVEVWESPTSRCEYRE